MSIREALTPDAIVELPDLNGLVDEIRESNRIQRIVAEQLESIRAALPIPFVPVEAKDPEHVMACGIIKTSEVKLAKLDEALALVRLILDTGGPGLPGSPNAARLFEVEAILSRELGNPIWEGGPK